MKQDSQSTAGSAYNLPVVDVDTQRRNFPGYVKYDTMLPLTDDEETTETDFSDPTEKREERSER